MKNSHKKFAVLALLGSCVLPLGVNAIELGPRPPEALIKDPAPVPPANCVRPTPLYLAAYQKLMVPKVSGMVVGAAVFQMTLNEFDSKPEAKAAWAGASAATRKLYLTTLVQSARALSARVEEQVSERYSGALRPSFCEETGADAALPTEGPAKEYLDFQVATINQVLGWAAEGIPSFVIPRAGSSRGDWMSQSIGFSELLPDFPFAYGASPKVNFAILLGLDAQGYRGEQWLRTGIKLYGREKSASFNEAPAIRNPAREVKLAVSQQVYALSPVSKDETAALLSKAAAPAWAVLGYIPAPSPKN